MNNLLIFCSFHSSFSEQTGTLVMNFGNISAKLYPFCFMDRLKCSKPVLSADDIYRFPFYWGYPRMDYKLRTLCFMSLLYAAAIKKIAAGTSNIINVESRRNIYTARMTHKNG